MARIWYAKRIGTNAPPSKEQVIKDKIAASGSTPLARSRDSDSDSNSQSATVWLTPLTSPSRDMVNVSAAASSPLRYQQQKATSDVSAVTNSAAKHAKASRSCHSQFQQRASLPDASAVALDPLKQRRTVPDHHASKALLPAAAIDPKNPSVIVSSPPSSPKLPSSPTLVKRKGKSHLLSLKKKRSSHQKRARSQRNLSTSSLQSKRAHDRSQVRFKNRAVQRSHHAADSSRPNKPESQNSHASASTPTTSFLHEKQAVVLNAYGNLTPKYCSEDPRFFSGLSLVQVFGSLERTPDFIHSSPVRQCANVSAHQGPETPYGHGVCSTCQTGAYRHIMRTSPDLLSERWWPLCGPCGYMMSKKEPRTMGCSCGKRWLCFECRLLEMELVKMKSEVEAQSRRDPIGVGVLDGNEKILRIGWTCRCGNELGRDVKMMQCAGCEGLIFGNWDAETARRKEDAFLKTTALKWT